MNKILLLIGIFFIMSCSKNKEETRLVEVACGQCQFELTTQEGCDLAVRIDGIPYFVHGADIDDFGDAHDENSGFCEVIRKGKATGKIVDDRYELASLVLIE
jgi:hypothetical protein